MKKVFLVFILFLISSTLIFSQKKIAQQRANKPYFPTALNWHHKLPQQAGFDTAKLKEAIHFAIEREINNPAAWNYPRL